MNQEKRVFFGFEVISPWSKDFPSGRLLAENCRHMTIAFLGNVDASRLLTLLEDIPPIDLTIGLTGYFDKILFLPERDPNVVAYHASWLEDAEALILFRKVLLDWLKLNQFSVDEKAFLPHVTVCRKPFIKDQWEKAFTPQPFFLGNFNLYESKGNLVYESLWQHPLIPPFKEIEHTADIGFHVYGKNLEQLLAHARTALLFKEPSLHSHFSKSPVVNNVEDIVIDLNEAISKADVQKSCSLKAVCFHGDVEIEQNILKWEMIIDV